MDMIKTNTTPNIKRAAGKPAAKSKRPTAARQTRKQSVRPAATPSVTFALYKPDAERVFLSGAFNGWSPESTPLTRQPNRDWQATVPLAPGRYEYKFVVDGKWMLDPRAPHCAPNEFGSLNSVIEVKA